MAKYKHTRETEIVLRDIENRLIQLIEASQAYEKQVDPKLFGMEQQALRSALMIVRQASDTGHVFRGSSAVPDGLLPYVKTASPSEVLA